ncbi:MAG: hypothetical protein PGN11_14935 [Quadrisphaera sp.]
MAAEHRRRAPRAAAARPVPQRRLPRQNWAIGANGQRYEGYPRYLFSNASADIISICCAALDRLGVAHTHPRRDMVSVARTASVAILDEHVGPKS